MVVWPAQQRRRRLLHLVHRTAQAHASAIDTPRGGCKGGSKPRGSRHLVQPRGNACMLRLASELAQKKASTMALRSHAPCPPPCQGSWHQCHCFPTPSTQNPAPTCLPVLHIYIRLLPAVINDQQAGRGAALHQAL